MFRNMSFLLGIHAEKSPSQSSTALFYYWRDRKSTRLNSSHLVISYAVFCLKKNKRVLTTHPGLVLVRRADPGHRAALRFAAVRPPPMPLPPSPFGPPAPPGLRDSPRAWAAP